MTLFDGYVAVDWSASDEPAHDANSIWIAVCDTSGTPELENPRRLSWWDNQGVSEGFGRWDGAMDAAA